MEYSWNPVMFQYELRGEFLIRVTQKNKQVWNKKR